MERISGTRSARAAPSKKPATASRQGNCLNTISSIRWSTRSSSESISVPSPLCNDEEYLRRVYLDVIGTLPTPARRSRFLADGRAERRATHGRIAVAASGVCGIFGPTGGPTYYRVDRRTLGFKQTYDVLLLDPRQLRREQTVRQIGAGIRLCGGVAEPESPAGLLYKTDADPGKIGSTISQVFLGIHMASAHAAIIPTTAGARPTTTACKPSSHRSPSNRPPVESCWHRSRPGRRVILARVRRLREASREHKPPAIRRPGIADFSWPTGWRAHGTIPG